MIEGHKESGSLRPGLCDGAELQPPRYLRLLGTPDGTAGYDRVRGVQYAAISGGAGQQTGGATSWLEYSKSAGVFFCPIEDELPHAEFGVAYRTDKRNPVMAAFLQIINQTSFNI